MNEPGSRDVSKIGVAAPTSQISNIYSIQIEMRRVTRRQQQPHLQYCIVYVRAEIYKNNDGKPATNPPSIIPSVH